MSRGTLHVHCPRSPPIRTREAWQKQFCSTLSKVEVTVGSVCKIGELHSLLVGRRTASSVLTVLHKVGQARL